MVAAVFIVLDLVQYNILGLVQYTRSNKGTQTATEPSKAWTQNTSMGATMVAWDAEYSVHRPSRSQTKPWGAATLAELVVFPHSVVVAVLTMGHVDALIRQRPP